MSKRDSSQAGLVAESHSKSSRTECAYALECDRSESGKIDERGQSDGISELIDMGLENIVGNIFTNLSVADVANAVTANPKWAEVVSGD